jgi:hypothetical protein
MIKKSGKFIAACAAVLIISILMFIPAYAADTRTGQNVDVAVGEVVNDDLYLAGSEVTVDGTVNGDVIAVGNRVTINGTVNGSVTVAASTITINGNISNSVRVAGNEININSNIGKDLVAITGSVAISSAGSIGRDLLAASGTVNVNGPVTKNITCNANRLVISNRVGGNVKAASAEVKLEPSASIAGNLEYSSPNEATVAAGAAIKGQTIHTVPEQAPAPSNQTVATALGAIVAAIIAFILGFIIVLALFKYAAALLVGIVVIFIARRHVADAIETLRNKPWPCLGWGTLIAVLTPIAAAILCILIVGIPLAIAVLAIYIIAIYIGHIITAIFLGKWMLRRLTADDSIAYLIGALALGLLIIYIVGLVPFISIITDLAVILFGFGSIVYYIKGKLV